jgi:hypothetical protein
MAETVTVTVRINTTIHLNFMMALYISLISLSGRHVTDIKYVERLPSSFPPSRQMCRSSRMETVISHVDPVDSGMHPPYSYRTLILLCRATPVPGIDPAALAMSTAACQLRRRHQLLPTMSSLLPRIRAPSRGRRAPLSVLPLLLPTPRPKASRWGPRRRLPRLLRRMRTRTS